MGLQLLCKLHLLSAWLASTRLWPTFKQFVWSIVIRAPLDRAKRSSGVDRCCNKLLAVGWQGGSISVRVYLQSCPLVVQTSVLPSMDFKLMLSSLTSSKFIINLIKSKSKCTICASIWWYHLECQTRIVVVILRLVFLILYLLQLSNLLVGKSLPNVLQGWSLRQYRQFTASA
jgi:hypothetical protein